MLYIQKLENANEKPECFKMIRVIGFDSGSREGNLAKNAVQQEFKLL